MLSITAEEKAHKVHNLWSLMDAVYEHRAGIALHGCVYCVVVVGLYGSKHNDRSNSTTTSNKKHFQLKNILPSQHSPASTTILNWLAPSPTSYISFLQSRKLHTIMACLSFDAGIDVPRGGGVKPK